MRGSRGRKRVFYSAVVGELERLYCLRCRRSFLRDAAKSADGTVQTLIEVNLALRTVFESEAFALDHTGAWHGTAEYTWHIAVLTGRGAMEANDMLDRFDATWYMQNLAALDGLVGIDIEYNSR